MEIHIFDVTTIQKTSYHSRMLKIQSKNWFWNDKGSNLNFLTFLKVLQKIKFWESETGHLFDVIQSWNDINRYILRYIRMSWWTTRLSKTKRIKTNLQKSVFRLPGNWSSRRPAAARILLPRDCSERAWSKASFHRSRGHWQPSHWRKCS